MDFRRGARSFGRLFADRSYRSVKLRAWLGGARQFQPFNTTRENRYPRVFSFLRDELGDRPDLRILSFGCSTGAEVFALAQRFGSAQIRGLDINAANIAMAQRQLAAAPDGRLSFAAAGTVRGEPEAGYDAVLCMAVLRDGRLGRAPPRCDAYLRFEAFDAAIGDLASVLKPGGLLALAHCNFRFADSTAARSFDEVLVLPKPARVITPIYGPDNCLIPGLAIPASVYRKR